MAKNEPKIYHHSSTKGIIFKIVVIIIAAVLILALTAFFGFRKYIAYTDTGKLYLDIPWLYGYMDGKPETDELAPYLEPVVTAKPDDNSDNDPDNANSDSFPSADDTDNIPADGNSDADDNSQDSTSDSNTDDGNSEDTDIDSANNNSGDNDTFSDNINLPQ